MRGVNLWCEALNKSSGDSNSSSKGPSDDRATAAALIRQALACFETSIALEDSAKAEASRTASAAASVNDVDSSSSSAKSDNEDVSTTKDEAAVGALSPAGAAAVAAAVAHLQQHRADAWGRARRRLFLGVSLLDLEEGDGDNDNSIHVDKDSDSVYKRSSSGSGSSSVTVVDDGNALNEPGTKKEKNPHQLPSGPPLPTHSSRAEQGLALLREAIAADPTCASAYLELVVALEEGKRCEEAREVAAQAITNCPSSPSSSSTLSSRPSNSCCSPFADPWQRPGFRDPSLRAMAWWPVEAVPFCAELTKEVEIVRREFQVLLAHNPHASPRISQGSSSEKRGAEVSSSDHGVDGSSGCASSWEAVGGGKRDGAGAHDGIVVGSTRALDSSSTGAATPSSANSSGARAANTSIECTASANDATTPGRFPENTCSVAVNESAGGGGSSQPSGDNRSSSSASAVGAWHEIVLLGRGAPQKSPAPQTVDLLRRIAPAACDLCDRGAGEVTLAIGRVLFLACSLLVNSTEIKRCVYERTFARP